MWTWRVLLLGMISEMHHCSMSICTAEMRGLAALASYISFVMIFLAIHQNMGPASFGHSCWQNCTVLSEINQRSQKLLHWLVEQTVDAHWLYRRGKDVEELQYFIFTWNSYLTFRFYVYQLNWETKCSKLAAMNFATAKYQQDTWNHYLMLGFVSAYIPWNPQSNLEWWWGYDALWRKQVLPTVSIPSCICWREYTMTADGIKKQLRLKIKVSYAVNRWTSTNTLAISLVIAS